MKSHSTKLTLADIERKEDLNKLTGITNFKLVLSHPEPKTISLIQYTYIENAFIHEMNSNLV